MPGQTVKEVSGTLEECTSQAAKKTGNKLGLFESIELNQFLQTDWPLKMVVFALVFRK
jgi:hypothetical protein